MVMKPTTIVLNPQVEQFWEGYFITLSFFRIPKGAQPWYRKHIEAYINYLPDTRLAQRNSEHIKQWLTQTGRNFESMGSDSIDRYVIDIISGCLVHRLCENYFQKIIVVNDELH